MSDEVLELVATAIEPSSELQVIYTPATLTDNLAALSAYVHEQVDPLVGIEIDVTDRKQTKLARDVMADLNKLKDPIETERKRINREHMALLDPLNDGCKAITSFIDDARNGIKQQLDDATAKFKARRRDELSEEYAATVGVIADVIPFSAVLESTWLNPSTNEVKAHNEMAAKAAKAVEGYESLQTKQLVHKDEVVKHYAETLDLIGALKLEDELNERDRQMAEFKAAQEAAAAVKAERTRPAPEPTQEPPSQPIQESAPKVFRWSLAMEFEGTHEYGEKVAATLKSLGITGAVIQCIGVVSHD